MGPTVQCFYSATTNKFTWPVSFKSCKWSGTPEPDCRAGQMDWCVKDSPWDSFTFEPWLELLGRFPAFGVPAVVVWVSGTTRRDWKKFIFHYNIFMELWWVSLLDLPIQQIKMPQWLTIWQQCRCIWQVEWRSGSSRIKMCVLQRFSILL